VNRDLGSDISTKLLWAEIALMTALVAFLSLDKFGRYDAFRGLSAFTKRLSEGIVLGGFGGAFLVVKWRARRLAPKNFWEFRSLLFDIAMVIGGVLSCIEAFRLR
jgi:hypothetical protein